MQQAMHHETNPFLVQAHVYLKKRKVAHTVESILHIPVVQDETGNLLLQPVILLHQQLVHRTQLSVHDL
jgi:hypothetical protein